MDTFSQSDDDIKQQILSAGVHGSRRKYWWLIFILFAIALLGGGGWFYQSAENVKRSPYQTVQVQQGDLTVQVTATGTLQPLDQVDVSSEASGTVKAVMVTENDLVKAGQTLLELDTTTLDAQVKQAQANVQMAQAQITQAEINLEEKHLSFQRKSELLPRNLVSDEELNAARSAYLTAKSTLQSSKANLMQVQANLALQQDRRSKATIVAPFDGVVLSRKIEPGQTVAASLQAPVLFVLARNLTQMELLLDIDEADVSSVKKDQVAKFTVDAFPSETFTAIISKVHLASQTVDGVVTYQAQLNFDNPDERLRPGMSATADITVAKVSHGLLVPNSALRFDPPSQVLVASRSAVSQLIPRPPIDAKKMPSIIEPGDHVWVLENNQPKRVNVKIGLSDGLNTEVLSGISSEDTVIISMTAGAQK